MEATRLLSVLFCAILVLNQVTCEETVDESAVVELTADTFDSEVNKKDYVLVMFYAPWCGHCKAMKPDYAKAAAKLKEEGVDVMIAKVDATQHSQLASSYNVTGYPTLKFRKNGGWIDYSGGRQTDEIVRWVKKKMAPSVVTLKTLSDAQKLIESDDVVVIAFSQNVISSVADAHDKYTFGHISSKEAFDHYKVDSDSRVIVFKKFDDGRADHTGEITPEALTEFIQKESIPLVVEFTQDTAGMVFGSPIRKHVVSFVAKSGDYERSFNVLKEVAKQFKGKAHFIVIDTDVPDNQRILEFFGMTSADVPGYRLINLAEDMTKFKPDSSEFTVDSIQAFIEEVLSGKRKPFLMSEDVPPPSTDPVRVLVGKNYNDVVSDLSKAVFVKLYAPWCGHCKQLAPIWDELGEAYKNKEEIVIAKMDATANEAEGLSVQSFPTLKYYPKGSSEPIDYTGERTLEALKRFVDSEGKDTSKKDEGAEDAADTHEEL
ncbi:unnamed protein product [Echinostoma caproni]|uniref:Protein disulfide-isomerase n=1 Tax=Echinostoma caproni TaxID=27848 RepID=A0A183AKP9_9TREM|nr:unnamed protein product [Echinostoma caproni]